MADATGINHFAFGDHAASGDLKLNIISATDSRLELQFQRINHQSVSLVGLHHCLTGFKGKQILIKNDVLGIDRLCALSHRSPTGQYQHMRFGHIDLVGLKLHLETGWIATNIGQYSGW